MTFSFTEKKRIRKDFGKQDSALDVPDLLTLQVESYDKFLQKDEDPSKRKNIGLQAAFNNLFPIESFSKNARLEFVSYRLEEPEFNVSQYRVDIVVADYAWKTGDCSKQHTRAAS